MAQDQSPEHVSIRIDPAATLGTISPDFIGFGYEMSALAQPGYFSAKDTALVQLYRNLGAQGLVRIGGDISDHAEYVSEGALTVGTDLTQTVINHAAIADFAGFLKATGWQAMWGLNLGTGTQEKAVEEAVVVDNLLKESLQSFEIGNEVDLRHGYTRPIQNFDDYHAAYLDYKAAIRGALPHAVFSGPDASGNLKFITDFVAAEASDMKLITTHYYRGAAKDPNSTIETLLLSDADWDKRFTELHPGRENPWKVRLQTLQQLCRDHRLGYRINEVNTYVGGGKQGVSDTFASALWCLDFMYMMASYGCEGINLQTDINQHGFISHYSPIVHDASGHCSARPEYYGVLAFAMAGKGELLKVDLNKGAVNLTAYATREGTGSIWLTVINSDLTRDAKVDLALPKGLSSAEGFRLAAPSAASLDHVTFAGAEVSPDGHWLPEAPEKIKSKVGRALVSLPHASGIVLHLGP